MTESLRSAPLDGSKRQPPKAFQRACWQCRRRKTHRSRGQSDSTSAHSQPNLNTLPLHSTDGSDTCQTHLRERLSKLEQLLDRFVGRKNCALHDFAQSPILVTARDGEAKRGLSAPAHHLHTVSSMGQGMLGAQTWPSASLAQPATNDTDGASGQAYSRDGVHPLLAALLPSQHDADLLFESSNGWMILDGIYRASDHLYVNRDHQSYALNMQAVAREHSIIIARTLLHLAVCMSSLPPEFNHSRLSSIASLDATVHNYLATVTSLVTSSDEQMLTLHGLETLLLLALYHMNTASLRQSWLAVRRGMNLAHLLGFQRIIAQPDLQPPIPAVSSAKVIWRALVDLDRFLGLHLRLPFGADDYPLPDDADLHLVHRSKVNALSRQIADLDREVSPQTYATALAMDEKLEFIMKETPKDFWEVPNVPSTARSPESFAALERLMVQMWHFEMKIFIHLPYLLRAPYESRYEFSKVTALQASRNVLMRWFALRNAGITQACYRFAEMGVFIAAVTLTLDIVIEFGIKEKCHVQRTKGTDFAMICRLISEMDKLANASPREKIAARSAIVLKKILSSLDPNKQSNAKARLAIPYFGTVHLAFQKLPLRPSFHMESDKGKVMSAKATGQHPPVFSFVSNSLWPRVDEPSVCEFDWDIVLFHGLEDEDTEGNWMF